MLDILRRIAQKTNKFKPENFRVGDSVTVYVKVREGEKERLQAYAGTVIKIQGAGSSRTFTVRKISSGIGVERCFPFTSPSVDRVDIISRGKVRRSKLYYLRDLKGKKAKIQFDTARDDKAKAAAAADATASSGEAKTDS